MKWIRGFLIITIGGLPATALLYLALFPLVGALSAFEEHRAGALATIVWFALAATGTMALWLASFLRVGPALCAGLLSGILAIGPFALHIVLSPIEASADGGFMVLLIAGPTVAALALIFAYLWRNLRRVWGS